MKANNILKSLFGLVCLLGLAACEDTDYQLYDTTQKDATFIQYIDENDEIVTSLSYSFGFDIATEYSIDVPVRLMGMTSDKDRTFSLEAAEGSTMKEGVHYRIDHDAMYIPANQVENKVRVTLLRDNDPLLQEKEFVLKLKLKESVDLGVVGQDTFKIVFSDIRPENAPSWWVSWGMPTYRFDVAQKFFELFYAMEEVNPAVVHEMTDRYGDYFVNATSMQGPIIMYSSFLNKFVLLPLWEYYEEHDPSVLVGWSKPTIY